jgi:hypothetical protein
MITTKKLQTLAIKEAWIDYKSLYLILQDNLASSYEQDKCFADMMGQAGQIYADTKKAFFENTLAQSG